MELESARRSYALAANSFADLVEKVPVGSWEGPGLGEWDLRALVGHTSRSLITVQTYLAQPADAEDLPDAAAYFAAVVSGDVATDASAIAERGRSAGRALGDDPTAFIRRLLVDVLALVEGSDDRLLTTIAGGMRLSRYLPTRTFELAVHSLDIAAATGVPFELPDDVAEEAAVLAVQIAHRLGRTPLLLRALTGRSPLPAGFSVV